MCTAFALAVATFTGLVTFTFTVCCAVFLGLLDAFEIPCRYSLVSYMMAGNGKTVAQGVFYLFVFSMGLGLPYIAAAIFFANIKGLFQWLKKRGQTIKMISGVLLVVMGLLLATDTFGYWAALFNNF